MKPYKLSSALFYAILLWVIGFIWGSTVFMIPALKNVSSIPNFSQFPAISFPILIISFVLAFIISKKYLKAAENKPREGLKLGMTFVFVNLLLDFILLFDVFGSKAYFGYVSVWLNYLILLLVPWVVGHSID